MGANGRGGEYRLGHLKKPVISELKAVVVLELEQLWIHNWGRADDMTVLLFT